jgi:hypothetical protein
MGNYISAVSRLSYSLSCTLVRRLCVSVFKCYGTFICNWVNWIAIYAVHIHQKASLIGIKNPF